MGLRGEFLSDQINYRQFKAVNRFVKFKDPKATVKQMGDFSLRRPAQLPNCHEDGFGKGFLSEIK